MFTFGKQHIFDFIPVKTITVYVTQCKNVTKPNTYSLSITSAPHRLYKPLQSLWLGLSPVTQRMFIYFTASLQTLVNAKAGDLREIPEVSSVFNKHFIPPLEFPFAISLRRPGPP